VLPLGPPAGLLTPLRCLPGFLDKSLSFAGDAVVVAFLDKRVDLVLSALAGKEIASCAPPRFEYVHAT
jgi:hypothetical protein